MALTNQQVQAAYLAIIGRPAEGSAVTWASGSFADLASLVSSIIDIRKGGDFSNNKETFVENLYQNLLGRPSDAEGKAFWLKALNDGASYAQVAQGFINAVLGQSQTEDLYKLQNKLDVAEKISAQINTFQGGAAAEATLKELMSTVNSNTTFANVEDSVKEFKGQNVDIANVTVKQGADKPAEGSDEHATVFKASITLGDDGINIKGSSSFADTLDLSVKGVKDDNESLTKIGTVSNIKTLNITTDKNVKTSNLDSSKVGGATSVTFKGSSSNDKFTANKAMTLLDTGNGDDDIILNTKVATVKAGTGDDKITVNAKGVAINIDGGNGNDTLAVSGASASIANAKINLGAGDDTLFVRAANIAGATINLGAGNDTIDIASILNPAYLKGTTIDGGVGRDTMLVIGDATKAVLDPSAVGLTLQNIEVLQAKGQGNNASKLSVSAINAQELTLTRHSDTNGTLEIIATNKETNIDLSKLNNNTESGETPLTALTLSNVGSGATTGVTVKLNKDNGIAETIKLAANAENVNINGFKSTEDKLNVKGIGATATWGDSKTLEVNKLAVIADNQGTITISGDKLGEAANKIITAGGITTHNGLTTGKKTYIAISNSTDTTNLYEITGDATAGLGSGDSVKLIATINGDALVANDLAFNA